MKVRGKRRTEKEDGQAALSLVLLVGGTVVLIAATLFFLVISFVNSTFGFQAANKAWGLVISGLDDGLLQISRNPTLGSQSYDFNVDDSVVDIKITRSCDWEGSVPDCSSSIEKNQVVITAETSVSGRFRKATLYASASSYGKIDVVSIAFGDGAGVDPI